MIRKNEPFQNANEGQKPQAKRDFTWISRAAKPLWEEVLPNPEDGVVLDLENGRVQLARNKTGVPRNLPLWPETMKALKAVPRSGQLVFYTAEGYPWVRTLLKIKKDGSRRYTSVNAVTSMFARLLKKAKINAPKGTGFYALRRTASTLAARSGDPFAVQRLLGHANLDMATRYVQDISEQTDRVIKNGRKYVVRREDVA